MKRILVLLTLAALTHAQPLVAHLRLTLDDGTQLDLPAKGTVVRSTPSMSYGVRVITPGKHVRLWVRNDAAPKLPDGRGGYLPTTELLLREAGASIPTGWSILFGNFIGAHKTGVTIPGWENWAFIDAWSLKPAHSQVPESTRSHYVDGGHQFWWDAVAPGHYPYHDPPTTGELVAKIREFREMGTGDLGVFPSKLQNLKRIWAVDLDPARYGVDDWVIRRFGFGPQERIPWRGTPAWWGCIQWADKYCNHHYDMVGHAVEAHLYGVQGGWLAATFMARKHLQVGIYDSGGHPFARMHVYEKVGGFGQYPGDKVKPQDSHEWDAGLIEWTLLSGDPMARELLERRATALAAYAPHVIWNGAGGVRQFGWTLRNMRAFTHYGIRDMRPQMAALIDHAIAANQGERWWRNSYTPKSFAPWMQALTNEEADAAIEGPLRQHPRYGAWRAYIDEKIRWQVENVVQIDAVTGQVTIPHNVDDYAAGQVTIRYQDSQMGWGIPQLATAVRLGVPTADVKLAGAKSKFLGWSRPYDESGAVGGGPAALKTWASAHQWAARAELWK